MIKTLRALVVVVVVILVMRTLQAPGLHPLSSVQIGLYGRESILDPAITLLAEGPKADPKSIEAFRNATLVDDRLCLYLTAFHVVEGSSHAWIGSFRSAAWKEVRFSPRWVDVPADLAIVQLIRPDQCPRVSALPIADRPPREGDKLAVYAFHPVASPFSTEWNTRGFRQYHVVLKNATDDCITEKGCRYRDYLRDHQAAGYVLENEELQSLYSQQIYVEDQDGATKFGVIPGMSGAPALDERRRIVGVVSNMVGNLGKSGLFAPAYVARDLLRQAREDIVSGRQ